MFKITQLGDGTLMETIKSMVEMIIISVIAMAIFIGCFLAATEAINYWMFSKWGL